jgi:hypothetical protein
MLGMGYTNISGFGRAERDPAAEAITQCGDSTGTPRQICEHVCGIFDILDQQDTRSLSALGVARNSVKRTLNRFKPYPLRIYRHSMSPGLREIAKQQEFAKHRTKSFSRRHSLDGDAQIIS